MNSSPIIKIGPITIDTNKQIVRFQRRLLDLPCKQYLILECLAKHQGQVVTRATLMEKIWNTSTKVWSNALDVHICELRKKLETSTGKKFIHTISGRGYKLTNRT